MSNLLKKEEQITLEECDLVPVPLNRRVLRRVPTPTIG